MATMERPFISGLLFVFQDDQRKRKWQSDIQRHLWSKSQRNPKNNLDLIFQCRDGEVAAHKLLFRTTSPVIKATVDVDLGEVRVLVPDVSIRTVRKSLELIYTGSVGLESVLEVNLVMHFCCEQLNIDMTLDWSNSNQNIFDQGISQEKIFQNYQNPGLTIVPVTSNQEENILATDNIEQQENDLSVIEEEVIEYENASIVEDLEEQENESIIEEISNEVNRNQKISEFPSNNELTTNQMHCLDPTKVNTFVENSKNSGGEESSTALFVSIDEETAAIQKKIFHLIKNRQTVTKTKTKTTSQKFGTSEEFFRADETTPHSIEDFLVPNDVDDDDDAEDDDDLQILEEIPVQRESQNNSGHSASSLENETFNLLSKNEPDGQVQLSKQSGHEDKEMKSGKNKTGKCLQEKNVSRLKFKQSKSKAAKPVKVSRENRSPASLKNSEKQKNKNKQTSKKTEKKSDSEKVRLSTKQNNQKVESENFFQAEKEVLPIMEGSSLELNIEIDKSKVLKKKKKPVSSPISDSKMPKQGSNKDYGNMVMTAISKLNANDDGSTRPDIANFLIKNFAVSSDEKCVKQRMRQTLRVLVKKGILIQQGSKNKNPKFKINNV